MRERISMYRGKSLEECTKEELIEAMHLLDKLHKESMQSARRINDLNRERFRTSEERKWWRW